MRRLRRTPGPRPADSPAPYRGLKLFQQDDAPWFFGRQREVQAVLDLLTAEGEAAGIVAVVGASGSGKSSLLRAGVMARLAGRTPLTLITPAAIPGRRWTPSRSAMPSSSTSSRSCSPRAPTRASATPF